MGCRLHPASHLPATLHPASHRPRLPAPPCSIYDAIGRGKRCVVYKGRRKRTVEWVAIKSTDRDQKASVLLEVRARLRAVQLSVAGEPYGEHPLS